MNRSKDIIIQDIKDSFNEYNLNLLKELLQCLISDARFRNDVAVDNDILLNQGEIRCCTDIIRYLD